MTTKTLQVMMLAALLANSATAQQMTGAEQSISARDCMKVAAYFHSQELAFRARAQNTIDRYANCLGKYPMATKTVTRAEVAERQYSEYLSKADENARLAAGYDAMLEQLGIKPPKMLDVVSVKDLQAGGLGGQSFRLLRR